MTMIMTDNTIDNDVFDFSELFFNYLNKNNIFFVKTYLPYGKFQLPDNTYNYVVITKNLKPVFTNKMLDLIQVETDLSYNYDNIKDTLNSFFDDIINELNTLHPNSILIIHKLITTPLLYNPISLEPIRGFLIRYASLSKNILNKFKLDQL